MNKIVIQYLFLITFTYAQISDNGICGTSSRTQKTYYITNCSMHSELQEIIKESGCNLKENYY